MTNSVKHVDACECSKKAMMAAARRSSDPTDSSAGEPVSAALLRALAAHPDLMAVLIQALNAPVRNAVELLNLMAAASKQAVALLPEVHWAGVTAEFDEEGPFTAAHTDDTVLIVDEYQYAQHDGPCLRALRIDREVRMTMAEVELFWPRLAAGARAAGVNSFLALPLHLRGRAVGSLNLYSADTDGFTDPDHDVLTVLTEYLGRGLARYADHRPEQIGFAIRAAVAGRAVIDQAVGVLMATRGYSAGQARDLLHEQARMAGNTTAVHAAHVITQRSSPPGERLEG